MCVLICEKGKGMGEKRPKMTDEEQSLRMHLTAQLPTNSTSPGPKAQQTKRALPPSLLFTLPSSSLLFPPLPFPQHSSPPTTKKNKKRNIPIQSPTNTINPILTPRTQRQNRRKRIPAGTNSDIIARQQFNAVFAVEADPGVGAGVEGDADS